MKRLMMLLLVEESDEPPVTDTTGETIDDEPSRIVARARPVLAKCGKVVELAQRRVAGGGR